VNDTPSSNGERPQVVETDSGPFGDMRPDNTAGDPRANPSLPQADVEDRENVSTVKPEDYPVADRAIASIKRSEDYPAADEVIAKFR
jgi:hypothetical protein